MRVPFGEAYIMGIAFPLLGMQGDPRKWLFSVEARGIGQAMRNGLFQDAVIRAGEWLFFPVGRWPLVIAVGEKDENFCELVFQPYLSTYLHTTGCSQWGGRGGSQGMTVGKSAQGRLQSLIGMKPFEHMRPTVDYIAPTPLEFPITEQKESEKDDSQVRA